MKSIYEKAILAKERRGEIIHLGKITSIRIDICVTQSFGKKTKKKLPKKKGNFFFYFHFFI